MQIHKAFPPAYLRASDIEGKTINVNIERCEMEQINGKNKPVLYLRNREIGMVLNRTNTNTIAEAYGGETENWRGHPLEIYTVQVNYQGRMVPGLRVRIPEPV